MAVIAGDGYSPDPGQKQQLSRIDDRLNSLVPSDVFRAISSTRELDALKVCLLCSSCSEACLFVERQQQH